MSIPPESPWRGAAAFLSQPVSQTDVLAAQVQVETIYKYNARCPITPPLADIEYRISDGELDTLHHVFRWDKAPYDFVFQNGFKARRQLGTPDNTYYNLERYVNNGGRPLDTRRDTTYAFLSTTLRGSWVPRVKPGQVDRVYRYEIYAPGGIWVAETLADRYHHPAQDEIAFPAGIAPQYIRSAQEFELTGERRCTRKRRLNTTLFINTNFNPQACPQRVLRLQRPVCDYIDENKQRRRLVVQEYPERRQKRAADDNIIDYYIEGVTKLVSSIDSIFYSTRNNEAYTFMKKEYVLMDYSPGSTNDHREMSTGSAVGGRNEPHDGMCYCGIPVVNLVSWTESNPGRRFKRCKKDGLGCGYSRWVDREIQDWQKDVSNKLLAENRGLKTEIVSLKERLQASESNQRSLVEEKRGRCQEGEGLRTKIVLLKERLQASESNQRSLVEENVALKIKLKREKCQEEDGGNVKLYAILTVVGGILIATLRYTSGKKPKATGFKALKDAVLNSIF